MDSHGIIEDLGIVIVCAVAVSVLFHRFRLPVIIGYLLTGVLIGPHLFEGGGLIHEPETIHQMAELGVIFLMFYIGMEFNLERLQKVFMPALLALMIQTVLMMIVGVQTAAIAGWDTIDGLFLGALLSISSSMVTISVLKERGELKYPRAQLAVGILIFEDILAVLLLVLLSGVGVTSSLQLDLVWLTTAGVGIFVVCVYFAGRLLAPKLLDLLERIGSIDLIVLTSVGFALGVGLLAMRFDFSVALGAFLAGAILSQTRLVREIEEAMEPLRGLFGAVFFVATGMLINPWTIFDAWLVVLVLSMLVIVGKVGACWLGLFLSGENPKTSFRAATVKSQIGEFSFIIASLGITLGVTEDRLMTVAVGVALITILTTPAVTAWSEPLYHFLARKLPQPVRMAGDFYTQVLDHTRQQLDRNTLLKLVRRPLLQITSYLFLLTGILLLASLLGNLLLRQDPALPYADLLQGGVWLLAAAACLPFLIAVLRNLNAVIYMVVDAAFSRPARQQFLQGRMRNFINMLVLVVVTVPVGALYLSLSARFLPTGGSLVGFFAMLLIAGLVLWKQMIQINSRLEYLFIESLKGEAKSTAQQRREQALREISRKYPWPVHVSAILVPEACGGRRLRDLRLREESGVMVVGIGRGDHVAFDPGPNTPLFPRDRLYVFGQDAQIRRASEHMSRLGQGEIQPGSQTTLHIERLYIQPDSPLEGETLAGADLRRKHGISVLGIQRGEQRITAPKADEIIKTGDVLFVIGNRAAIRRFQEPSAVEANS